MSGLDQAEPLIVWNDAIEIVTTGRQAHTKRSRSPTPSEEDGRKRHDSLHRGIFDGGMDPMDIYDPGENEVQHFVRPPPLPPSSSIDAGRD